MKNNNKKEEGSSYLIFGIIIAVVAVLAALLLVAQEQKEAYAQAVFYDQINEQQQAFISQMLDKLQNQTVDSVSIWGDSGSMFVHWTEKINATAPDGTVFEITKQTDLTIPTNFTTSNGYQYRDNTIFKPDGTKLFGD